MNNMANFHEIALYMDDTLREQVHLADPDEISIYGISER